MQRTSIPWKVMFDAPADGITRVCPGLGLEYRHIAGTKIKCEQVLLHDGDDAMRRIRYANGKLSLPDRVSWR